MNLSEVMTRIKFNLGIANIATPIKNIDGMIAMIIKDITIRDFSRYQPDRIKTKINLQKLKRLENMATYEVYLLPDFGEKKLLYVFNVEYDDSSLSGFGHYGGALPYVGSNMMGQVMMSNAAAHLYSVVAPKMTFRYEHPRKIYIYNQYSETHLVFDLGFEHDKSLASIPETCLTSFMELATLDVKSNLYPIFKNYTNISSAYGNIDLKIESWENAESERKDLISRWDDVYHLDMIPMYYA
jgi:hypothetical protein